MEDPAKENPFFPSETEGDMEAAFKLLATNKSLPGDSYQIWRMTMDALPQLPEPEPASQRDASVDWTPMPPPRNMDTSDMTLDGPSDPNAVQIEADEDVLFMTRLAMRAQTNPAFERVMSLVASGTATKAERVAF